MVDQQKVKKTAEKKQPEKAIGKVVHYYTNIGVAVIELKAVLKVGDKIRIKGHTSDFSQKVESIQMEHDKLQEAKSGQSIGLKVKEHVRQHDIVYKV